KLSFETTDVDGNKITSEEIFSKNEITMLNFWATWCTYCIGELPELETINAEFADKNCAIVGVLGDGKAAGKLEMGKDFLEGAGVTYLNILPWDDAINEDLLLVHWPCSYFVDKNGIILAKPVIGADVDTYPKAIDKLLKGESVEEEASDQKAVVPNDVDMYRVYVMDTDGNPVEGVMVKVCDDKTCNMEITDKDGLAVFKVTKNNYEVHLIGTPDGYRDYDKGFMFTKEYSDLHIVLEKE
nr:TlpA family protein disulfide reductase [Lachnospiraceae bacterium]